MRKIINLPVESLYKRKDGRVFLKPWPCQHVEVRYRNGEIAVIGLLEAYDPTEEVEPIKRPAQASPIIYLEDT